jgi:hypothetical protein
MEIEGRIVSICLVGVSHDKVEKEFEDTLKLSSIPGEVVFWESGYRKPRESKYPSNVNTGHWGIEERFFTQMTYIYSMVVTYRLELDSDLKIGHGYFLESFHEEFLTGIRKGIKFYDKLPIDHKMIFCLATVFFQYFREMLIVYGVEYTVKRVSEYFNYNETIVSRFMGSVTRCLTRMTFKGIYLTMNKHTVVNTLIDFVIDFESLLSRYKDELPLELHKTVGLLIELIDNTSQTEKNYADLLVQSAVTLRDSSNWKFIYSFVENYHSINNIIIVCGYGHIEELYRIIMKHNASIQEDEKVRFVNLTKITPPYTKENIPNTETEITDAVNFTLNAINDWRKLNK